MEADEAPGVLARRSRLRAKARRVRDVFQRQAIAIEDLVAMEVRQRHLSGGHQPQVLTFDAECVGSKLRQIGGARHRRAVDEHGRQDLDVAVLARVRVEHELHQGPLQSGPLTD